MSAAETTPAGRGRAGEIATVLFMDHIGATPLESIKEISNGERQRLSALSITSVVELLSAVQAAPAAMARTLPGTDLAQLQADLGRRVSPALSLVRAAAVLTADLDMALGAEPPENVFVEQIALESTFLAMLDELPGRPVPDGEPVDFRHCFGSVRNQGKRGTCVGHAGAAVMERAHFLSTGHQVTFSPQFLFHSAKMSDRAPTVDGTWSTSAMPTLLDKGICEEEHWPYVPTVVAGNVHQGPPPQDAIDAAAKHTAMEVIELDPRDSATIRAVVAAGHAVTISVPVYENWYGPLTRSYGKVPLPLPSSPMLGGHAVCVVGYGFDDEFTGGGFFLFRNSWSARWAANSPIEPGYGAIPFEYLDRYGWEAFAVRG
jgi:hypothetical protein